jgi:hypothetical protein
MKMIAAWIQVISILLIVGYGTWQLFEGNFALSFATLPFLFVYYIFVVARLRRKQFNALKDHEDN